MLNPPVGTMVQFWPHAETGPDARPYAAVVVREGAKGSGLVKLNMLLEGGGEMKSNGEFVHHISDPWVKEHREQLRMGRGNAPRGVWDWIPGYLPSNVKKSELSFAAEIEMKEKLSETRRQKEPAKV